MERIFSSWRFWNFESWWAMISGELPNVAMLIRMHCASGLCAQGLSPISYILLVKVFIQIKNTTTLFSHFLVFVLEKYVFLNLGTNRASITVGNILPDYFDELVCFFPAFVSRLFSIGNWICLLLTSYSWLKLIWRVIRTFCTISLNIKINLIKRFCFPLKINLK